MCHQKQTKSRVILYLDQMIFGLTIDLNRTTNTLVESNKKKGLLAHKENREVSQSSLVRVKEVWILVVDECTTNLLW